MTPQLQWVVAGLVLWGASGCASFGVLQTAHTQAPGRVRVAVGANTVMNRVVSESTNDGADTGSARWRDSSYVDASARVGLTDQLDIGTSPFDLLGLAVDAKVNLIDRRQAFALAPRLGAGFARPKDYRHAMIKSGLIASYRVGHIEPYVGAIYSNHWIRYDDSPPALEPGERLVSRNGFGNGLAEFTVGVDVRLGRRFGFTGEITRTLPLNDDPGDRFQYVPSSILAAGMRWSMD